MTDDTARRERAEKYAEAKVLSGLLTPQVQYIASDGYRAGSREEAAIKDAEIERLEVENDQLRRDRYDALSVTSKDGLLSSEWVLRTGTAERRAKEAAAEIAALREAVRRVYLDDHEIDIMGCECFSDWKNLPAVKRAWEEKP